MGSGSSRMGSGGPRRAGPQQSRWPTIKRTISSLLVCGASSSRTPNDMEDYPAELLVNSADHGKKRKKLKSPRNDSGLSLSNVADQNSNKVEYGVSSESSDNPSREVGTSSNVEPSGKGKCLSESRELVPSHQFNANFRGTESASTSYLDQPSPDYFSVNEMDGVDDMSRNIETNGDQSQVGERISNSNGLFSHGHGESFLDEVSVENNLTRIDSDSAVGPDSLVDFHTPQGVVSEREQNRQHGSQVQVDLVGISSNILSGNSAEIRSRELRRNSRRLFWDAFSRRSSRRHTDSRTFVFSPDDSDHLRSHDRWLLDFTGDFLTDDVGSRPQGRIHSEGSCSCQSGSSAEEYGTRAGISRIVMLAEALFEVLDQIHQQPMSLSLSMVSLPAPESIVDSFPVKTYTKRERTECANDVSQCYICLSEYEEGDKIRVLPCHHEYHMSCVDKWLKEIHGVCPLCRGDVRDGFTEASDSN
ncbi:hypothetical protein ACJIZ3_025308 [Penstemon smallii]|uniref:RING-type domain-containing protein n=1 Tax=Penstemon smallii TaxID=265156 RepID=A0ABD3TVA0_9LAMI